MIHDDDIHLSFTLIQATWFKVRPALFQYDLMSTQYASGWLMATRANKGQYDQIIRTLDVCLYSECTAQSSPAH